MHTVNLTNTTPDQLLDQIKLKALRARSMYESAGATEKTTIKREIKQLLQQKNAVIVAHFYVDADLQQLAEETGGHVADSLDMAYFGKEHRATTLVVCGVRFMGETAKILTPEKTVLMPSLEAECSLDIGCPIEEFRAFRNRYPDHTAVVYANTSAAVKAAADWVVTSGNALQIVRHLQQQGKRILWAPDRHLGNWVQSQTGADIVCWQGHCVVHDEFKETELEKVMQSHPDAMVIAHPESPAGVLHHADVVGSTKVLIKTVNQSSARKFIVATDEGIFYKMRQSQPGKSFLLAPTGGKSAACTSCGKCPWMAINSLARLRDCLTFQQNAIEIPEPTRRKAITPIERMLDFSRDQGLPLRAIGDA